MLKQKYNWLIVLFKLTKAIYQGIIKHNTASFNLKNLSILNISLQLGLAVGNY